MLEYVALLTFRILNACIIRTSGPPDEYWQGPEVGYWLAFGKGTLTWEWEAGIRSWLHPMTFGLLFKGLDFFGCATPTSMVYSPRIIQGVVAFLADVATIRLSGQVFKKDPSAQRFTTFFVVLNWFVFYCAPRTLSNSTEAALSLVALNYLLSGNYFTFLNVAGLTTVFRPTSCVLWLPCGVMYMVQNPDFKILLKTGFTVVVWVVFSVALDYSVTGTIAVNQIEFLKFNFVEGKSALFGTHPWHWYITQGYPAIIGTMLPFFIAGLWRWEVRCMQLYSFAAQIGTSVFFYSLIGHKEFRFLLPVLYLGLVVAGGGCSQLFSKKRKIVVLGLGFIMVSNIVAMGYFSYLHQTGGVELMSHLRRTRASPQRHEQLHLLLPCYTTPGYSYLHGTSVKEIVQLDCSPLTQQATEHDLFNTDPLALVTSLYHVHRQFPTLFAIFSQNRILLEPFLHENGYKQEAVFPHSPTPAERGHGHEVLLYSKI